MRLQYFLIDLINASRILSENITQMDHNKKNY